MIEIILAVFVTVIVCIVDVSSFVLDEGTEELLYSERVREFDSCQEQLNTDTDSVMEKESADSDESASADEDVDDAVFSGGQDARRVKSERISMDDPGNDFSVMADEFLDDIFKEVSAGDAK